MKLFRDEAVEGRRRRLWGEVRLAQPPSLTAWTVVMVGVFCMLISVLTFGRYTRVETVSGFLYAEDGVVDVRPAQAGRVSRVMVREGQKVAVGDALMEFTSDLESVGSGPKLDVQLQEVDRQLSALEQRRVAVGQSYAAERMRLDEQVDAQRKLWAILAGQREGQLEALALAQRELDRFAELQAQGFAPAGEVDRRRRTVLAEQSALRDLDAQIANSEARISDLHSQISAMPSRQTEIEAYLNSENARLMQQRAELALARGHILRAPVAGTVTRILARDGFVPQNNNRLLTIAPQGSLLYARVLVPTRAIGFLKVGQTVNLKIDAFPFQQFGMVRGYVSKIHPMVVRPGDMAYPIEHNEPMYEIDVFLTREHLNAYGERREFRPGMLLSAEMPIDTRRLWRLLLDPLLAAGRRFAA